MSGNFPILGGEGCAHDWYLYEREHSGTTVSLEGPPWTLFEMTDTWYCRRCRLIEKQVVIEPLANQHRSE